MAYRRCILCLLSAVVAVAACSSGYYPDRVADSDGVIEMEPLEIDAGLRIDRDRFEDDYMGQTLRVLGGIASVVPAGGGRSRVEIGQVFQVNRGSGGSVFCETDEALAAGLKRFDEITVVGRYAETHAEADTILAVLSDCEVVRASGG